MNWYNMFNCKYIMKHDTAMQHIISWSRIIILWNIHFHLLGICVVASMWLVCVALKFSVSFRSEWFSWIFCLLFFFLRWFVFLSWCAIVCVCSHWVSWFCNTSFDCLLFYVFVYVFVSQLHYFKYVYMSS